MCAFFLTLRGTHTLCRQEHRQRSSKPHNKTHTGNHHRSHHVLSKLPKLSKLTKPLYSKVQKCTRARISDRFCPRKTENAFPAGEMFVARTAQQPAPIARKHVCQSTQRPESIVVLSVSWQNTRTSVFAENRQMQMKPTGCACKHRVIIAGHTRRRKSVRRGCFKQLLVDSAG